MIARARSGCLNSSTLAGLVMLAAAAASSLLTGAALGAFGLLLDHLSRAVLFVIALLLTAFGVWTKSKPWQLDRETATHWLSYRNWRTVALNGGMLGLGFSTRIGFWLFYLVPIVAMATHSILLAALIYGTYGVSRIGLSLLQVAVGPRLLNRMSYGVGIATPITEIAVSLLAAYLLISSVLTRGSAVT